MTLTEMLAEIRHRLIGDLHGVPDVLLYGDGVITPAISVFSAVEGLKIDAPRLAPTVVPITIAILIALFLVQRKGTEFVGNIFGPVMLVWFVAIGQPWDNAPIAARADRTGHARPVHRRGAFHPKDKRQPIFRAAAI
jgi:K+ transporter